MKNTIPNTSPVRFDVIKQEINVRKSFNITFPLIKRKVTEFLTPFIGKKLLTVDRSFVKRANKSEFIKDLTKELKFYLDDSERHIYLTRLTLAKRTYSNQIELMAQMSYADRMCHGGGYSCSYVEFSLYVGETESDDQTLKAVHNFSVLEDPPSYDTIQRVRGKINELKKELSKEEDKLPYWAKD